MEGGNGRWLLRGAVVALAVVVGFIAWLATREEGGESPMPAQSGSRIVSASELSETAAGAGHPVYWAGPEAGKSLELIEATAGPQVRYVPAGTEAGKGPAASLTIGSYPLPDATASLRGFATRPGSIVRHGAGGREVVSSAARPTSVYFASPDNRVEVEVYDPSPRRAMSLALSGRVRPVP